MSSSNDSTKASDANKKVSRRTALKVVGGAVVVGAAAVLGGYYSGAFKAGPTATTATASVTSSIKPGGTLTMAIDSDIVRLDPHASSAAVDRVVYQSLYGHFLDLNLNSEVIPAIAQSWTQPDSVSYVFTLRDGVKFHDGTPLDADAVKFNFDRMMGLLDAKLLPTPNNRKSEISSIDKVTVVDSKTVKMALKQPFAPILSVLTDRAGMLVSPTALQKDPQGFVKNPIGAGPFKFVEWISGDHVTLNRFENYYEPGLPYLDTVIIKPITDGSTRLLAVESGTVDFIRFFNDSDINKVKSDVASGKFGYVVNSSYGFQGFEMNTMKAPFDNKSARQAVHYAIDVQQFIDTVTFGVEQAINGPITQAHGAYFETAFKPFDKWPHGDPDLAKQALQQAGMPNGFSFDFKTVSNPLNRQIAELFQSQLAAVGIKMNIVQEDFTRLLTDSENHDFQAAAIGWSGRPDPDQNVYVWFHSTGSFNDARYSNPTVDSLLDQARSSTSTSDRVKLYQQAVRLIVSDAPYQFTTAFPNSFDWNSTVKEFSPIPDGMVRTTRMYKG
jgi:peptide/nickel transport system substrate-binding protein